DLGADRGGFISKVAALFELLDHLHGLGAQAARNLVLAPFGFDLVAHFIERTLARRRDADHVVPDIAAVELDRVVVDAEFAVESLRAHIGPARAVGAGLPVRHAAGTGDGIDRHGGEPELLRGLDDAGAAAALVFHLALQLVDLGARVRGGDLLLDGRRHAFITWHRGRLDLADL